MSAVFNKIVLPAVAVLALGYAAFATEVMRPREVKLPPLSAPPARPFAHTVAAVGLIEPASETIAVGPRVPGWIAAVHVVAGQQVAPNEPLLTLEGTDLAAELALRQQTLALAAAKAARLRALPRAEDVPIARAAVAEAQARLADARANLRFLEGVSDPRAVREEELSQRQKAADAAGARAAQAEAELDKLNAGAWQPDLAIADQEVAQAQAAVARTEADLERLTVRAPIDGVVLKVHAHPGEYATAGAGEPLLLLGSPPPWHARVDVDEENAGRVAAGAAAVAVLRGDSGARIALQFVRFEPFVTPKHALSGFANERVDTRALQVIYRLEHADVRVFPGQQVDVFIEAAGSAVAAGATGDGR